MNDIIIGGKMASSMKKGKYPDGTQLLSFQIKESYKGGVNRFKVVVTGEDNIRFCTKHLKGGAPVFVRGHVRVKNHQVKDAAVLVDGNENELVIKDFIVKAYEVSDEPFS